MIYKEKFSLLGLEFDNTNILKLFEKIFPNLEYETCFLSGWSEVRKKEFLLARNLALELINKAGDYETNLIRLEDGQCLWPNNLTGSISHTLDKKTHDFNCIVIIGTEGELLGVDIESIERFDELDPRIFINDDEKIILNKTDIEKKILYSIIFSSKESIYKAIYPLYLEYFGFDSATVNEFTQLSDDSYKTEFVLSKKITDSIALKHVEVICQIGERLVITEFVGS